MSYLVPVELSGLWSLVSCGAHCLLFPGDGALCFLLSWSWVAGLAAQKSFVFCPRWWPAGGGARLTSLSCFQEWAQQIQGVLFPIPGGGAGSPLIFRLWWRGCLHCGPWSMAAGLPSLGCLVVGLIFCL